MADIRLRSGRPFYRIESDLAEILVALGLADYLKSVQPGAPTYPPRGWRVETILSAGVDQTGNRESVASTTKFVIAFHDGFGGKQIYTGPPSAQRVWSGEKQDYILKESDCPDDVVQQWRAVNGLPTENERKSRVAEADQRRKVEQFMQSQPNPYGLMK
jgi:hypothetical protein